MGSLELPIDLSTGSAWGMQLTGTERSVGLEEEGAVGLMLLLKAIHCAQ